MTLDEYNSLPKDLKLDARLAITLGHELSVCDDSDYFLHIKKRTWHGTEVEWRPRQDPAILWGLIGDYVELHEHSNGIWGCILFSHENHCYAKKTKEEALIEAYCAADTQGHWAKWCKDNEVTV